MFSILALKIGSECWRWQSFEKKRKTVSANASPVFILKIFSPSSPILGHNWSRQIMFNNRNRIAVYHWYTKEKVFDTFLTLWEHFQKRVSVQLNCTLIWNFVIWQLQSSILGDWSKYFITWCFSLSISLKFGNFNPIQNVQIENWILKDLWWKFAGNYSELVNSFPQIVSFT